MKDGKGKIIIAGGIVGLLAALLVKFGNPVNMGVCIACFYRDIAGALGLHKAEAVQYIRPEIIGIILGSFIISQIKGEFRARGGSSPILRFVLGFFLMIGALVFLGCPLRMILRLANGDLNAITGLFGYIFGIYIGIQFIKRGFSLGKNVSQPQLNGYIMPLFAVGLLILLIAKPTFILFSESGPGSMTAPIIIALTVGLIVGFLLQRTRLCTAGGFRDAILIKDFYFLWGLIALFAFNIIGNLILNPESIKIAFTQQPVAHNVHVWNFLGMALTGIASVLLGGCPLRQTILAGEGDTDATITILGLMAGAAFAHNFSLAASPQGVGINGKVAVLIGLATVLTIGYSIVKYNKKIANKKEDKSSERGISHV